jgi:hypothetical protein
MLVIYPAQYHDRFGEEITSIQNDGKILHKQEYLGVKGKIAFFQFDHKYGKKAERVQETYLCPQYEKRVLGTGYRG